MPTATSAAGPLLLVSGAAMFSSANCCAKALYVRQAINLVSLFLLRSLIVYLMNAVIVTLRRYEPVRDVLGVRVRGRHTLALLVLRSAVGAAGIVLLNLSFAAFLTFADSFAIFMGVSTLLTIVGARALLGGERLGLRVLIGGAATLLGIGFITQPPAIFGSGGTPVSAAGVAIAASAATLLSAFILLTRILTRKGGTHSLSPAMMLSCYMVVLGVLCGGAVLGAGWAAPAVGWAAPDWARIVLPVRSADWALFLAYNTLIVGGQLTNAAGMARTPAGPAAILMATELAFAYLLDVMALDEPTNVLASLGCAAIFVGVACASRAQAIPTETAPLATATATTANPQDWLEAQVPPPAPKGPDIKQPAQARGAAGKAKEKWQQAEDEAATF